MFLASKTLIRLPRKNAYKAVVVTPGVAFELTTNGDISRKPHLFSELELNF